MKMFHQAEHLQDVSRAPSGVWAAKNRCHLNQGSLNPKLDQLFPAMLSVGFLLLLFLLLSQSRSCPLQAGSSMTSSLPRSNISSSLRCNIFIRRKVVCFDGVLERAQSTRSPSLISSI